MYPGHVMASTRHLVDPELLQLLDEFPPVQLSRAGLADLRAAGAALTAQQLQLEPAFPDIEVAERSIPGPEGAPDVRVLTYTPKNAPRPLPALVWIHGGGYVLGTPAADGLQMKTLVTQIGCVEVSADYRLAPESPFPPGVESFSAALPWTQPQAPQLVLDR